MSENGNNVLSFCMILDEFTIKKSRCMRLVGGLALYGIEVPSIFFTLYNCCGSSYIGQILQIFGLVNFSSALTSHCNMWNN